MQRLLDQLNSRDPTVQADALRDARALSPDDLLRLILCADKLQKVRLRRRFALRILIAGLFSVSLLVSGLFKYPIGQVLNFCSYMVASVCTSMFYNTYWQARRQIRVVLQEVDDTCFIPHLMRSIGGPYDEGLREALRRLLPQVRADHAPQWSKADKATLLIQFKKPTHDTQLTLCCLKALEQIGDKSAVPAVKKLMEQAFLNNWKTLWRAAKECLLYLESNSGKFQQAETLLRSSDSTQVQPDILLRPAASDADNSAGEQLLRPGISNDAP